MEQYYIYLATSVVALFFKMLAISGYQGFYRIRNTAFCNPEDAKFFNKEPVAQELPQVIRASKVWNNDLENIPIFISLAIVYVFVQAPIGSAPYLFYLFVVSRFLHSLFYLAGIQPWRHIAYLTGQFTMIGMCFLILNEVL